jgi:tRNA (cmo5U34)-methyltransferase
VGVTIPDTGWSEENSQLFIDMGEAITPSRSEQIDMLMSLLPADTDEPFVAVDLACGAGLLTGAILDRFPLSSVIALDGSPTMLHTVSHTFGRFGARLETRLFDLRERGWLESLPTAIRCFVSSLAIHHLDAAEKQSLFRDLQARLEPGGALLIVDIVEPANERARLAYAAAWDRAVREQSQTLTGSLAAYERFQDGWNHYLTPDVDFDKPSNLYEQLDWLSRAGFQQVDCFWLRAGHAIYGGFK